MRVAVLRQNTTRIILVSRAFISFLCFTNVFFSFWQVVSMDCCNHCWSDCEAFLNAGHSASGVYHVYPQGMRTGYDVFCDMSTDGGGWLVSLSHIYIRKACALSMMPICDMTTNCGG